jgi:hypothetical protein
VITPKQAAIVSRAVRLHDRLDAKAFIPTSIVVSPDLMDPDDAKMTRILGMKVRVLDGLGTEVVGLIVLA